MLEQKNSFLIGPAPMFTKTGWSFRELGEEVFLSYSPQSDLFFGEFVDGKVFAIVGFATSVLEDSALALLSRRYISDIDQIAAYFCGRWAILTAEHCISDASGLLPLFYRSVEGTVWISSSPRIVGKHLGCREAKVIDWHVVHGPGIDWIPAPYSTRRGVYRLLPQRSIEPLTGHIKSQEFYLEDGPSLLESLTTAMKRWCAGFSAPWISLTAGLDTRTLLAVASYIGGDFKTFTYKLKRMPRHDIKLPEALSQIARFTHEFWIPTSTDSSEREKTLLVVSDDACINGGYNYLQGIGESQFRRGETIIMGSGFELGRCFYWNRLRPDKPDSAKDILDAIDQQYRSPIWFEAFDCYIKSLDEKISLDLDWRDRFYLDQRLGSFGAAHHFYDDLQGLKRIDIGNCSWIFHLLLNYEPSDRIAGTAQQNLIETCNPQLLSIPINPRSQVYDFTKKILPVWLQVRLVKCYYRILRS